MTCATVRERLGELVTDALEGAEHESVARHVRACAACRAELAAIRGIDDRLRRLGPKKRTRSLWYGAAAAVLAAAGLTAVIPSRAVPSVLAGSVVFAGETAEQGDRLPWGDAVSVLAPSDIRLPDGTLVRAEKGARLVFDRSRRVRLAAGEACFSVTKAATQFEVETPRGRVEVKGTRFTVRVEEAAMGTSRVVKGSAAAAGLAVVVAAGVVVYRDYVTGSDSRVDAGMEAVARGRTVETRRVPTIETGRLATDLAQTKRRLADVERELSALQESAARNGETLLQVLDTQRRLASVIEKLEAMPASATSPIRTAAEQSPAQAVGDLLHLDAGRQAEFEGAYAELLRRIREAEASHATATTSPDGATTTIQIARFPESGAALTVEWKDWLTRSLTPDEKAKYDKYKLGRNLLPRYPDWRPLGELERTVRIDRTRSGVSIVETGVSPDGSNFSTSNSYSADDAEKALAQYRHLMK